MFPSILNTFNRPSPTDRLNSPSHSALHNTVSSAVGQIEAFIGKEGASSTVGTILYDVRSPDSGGGGHVQSANKGGTGQTTYTKGDILVATSSSVLSKLSVSSVAGDVLTPDTNQASGIKWASASSVLGNDQNPIYTVGVLKNALIKTYFNFQLPFTLWTGSTSGALTTDFVNWIRSSTDIFVAPMGLEIDFAGTGADVIYLASWFYPSAGATLKFNSTNIVILDFWAKLPSTGTGDLQMGFNNNPGFNQVYDATTVDRVQFNIRGSTGVLYATIAKQSVGVTNTDISTGITTTNWNNYRIEYDIGNNALFYVNGVLKATLSGANLPSSAETILLGFGRSNTALFQVTAPTLSIEMNP